MSDTMYGPVRIGGPCALCGIKHPGDSCEQAKAEVQASVGRISKLVKNALQMAKDQPVRLTKLRDTGAVGDQGSYEQARNDARKLGQGWLTVDKEGRLKRIDPRAIIVDTRFFK